MADARMINGVKVRYHDLFHLWQICDAKNFPSESALCDAMLKVMEVLVEENPISNIPGRQLELSAMYEDGLRIVMFGHQFIQMNKTEYKNFALRLAKEDLLRRKRLCGHI